PGEKLYEELLLSGEGMQKTRNDLIYIGHELPFDKERFAAQLQALEKWSEPDGSDLRRMIAQIVPTYHEPSHSVACEEEGAEHAASRV
ncbi:MAG: polysaccharide biosynthesis protein, partial [Oscillospiraceae bacterium]|nr:polysaccharide biosynthesis protein [Oscillospiraceae bacterium]